MKNISALIILWLVCLSDILPQAPDTLWTKKIGGTGQMSAMK
jgi:hypothetical protein